MKQIYLTEEQFNYIIDNQVLNESQIIQTVFKNCHTTQDYINRIFLLAKRGAITLGLLTFLIHAIPNLSNTEKETVKNEVIEVMEEVKQQETTPIDNNLYAQTFNISQEGINHIMNYEKIRLDAYYATNAEKESGILTVGIGHKITANDVPSIRNLKEGDTITREQAQSLFSNDIQVHVKDFQRAVSTLPKRLQNASLYTQGFIDAAISITFNAGQPNMMKSNFFKTWKNCRIDKNTGKIDKSDYNYTVSMIPSSCITQKGVLLNGLVSRRQVEKNMAKLK